MLKYFFRPLRHFLDRRRSRWFVATHFNHVQALAATAERLDPLPARLPSTERAISFVVPVFNTPPSYLDHLLTSYRSQIPDYSELIFSDDGSISPPTRDWLKRHETDAGITIIRNDTNRGIAAATNAGISLARASFVGLLDHDDALAPFAVSRIVRALAEKPTCQFLYTDEVIADSKLRPIDYFLKPAWDPVLLSGVNYINHLSLYRRGRLLEIGGLRDGFQGSQDYDLLLRYTKDLEPDKIIHLPYPAYVWRRPANSYSANFLDTATMHARLALSERFARDDEPISVDCAVSKDLHRVRFDSGRKDWPLISIVIPNRDTLHLIERVLRDLTEKTNYPSLEIIVIDNGTEDPRVLDLYERYRHGNIPFAATIKEAPFNFSVAVNLGLSLAKGDYILLLNNDIEVIEPNWLKEMISCFDYPDTGIVGAKLLYPDLTIQHVGVIAGFGGLAGHWYTRRDKDFPGPMARLHVRQSMSIVTGACMLISRQCFEQVGPFDTKVFGIAYNDVDFCLRALAAGFRVVLTPFATLVHHESASRGSDETPQNIARFRTDQDNLRRQHGTDTFEDRAFNPWYSKHRAEPEPVHLSTLPAPR